MNNEKIPEQHQPRCYSGIFLFAYEVYLLLEIAVWTVVKNPPSQLDIPFSSCYNIHIT